MSIADWLDMMPDQVTIFAWVSRSVSNVPTYSTTGVVYPAHIELKNRLIVAANGQEVMSRGRIYLGTAAIPDVKDKLVLPSNYVPLSPPILAVNVSTDENGDHNTILEIG